MTVQIFGIRHHGPGSARSLKVALDAMQPDVLLIEGPPEADSIIPLCKHEQMQTPVAILVYAPEQPDQAVYYPFAQFSPEWQALQYALDQNVPVRFMDLPISFRLALDQTQEAKLQAQVIGEVDSEEDNEENDEDTKLEDPRLMQQLRRDPLRLLAQAAGYEDSERWWEHMVEERRNSDNVFLGIAEAMTALREEISKEPVTNNTTDEHDEFIEQLREAHMRKTLRATQKEGFQNIAVVCGAWHVPALKELPPVKQDNQILKNLPKIKTNATWIPWSYGRLSYAGGYGAGIHSPGWYHHLWNHENKIALHWLTLAARVFREEGLDISSAHIIESVRLADALTAMRGRPIVGLDELNEAIQTVMLFGDALPMRLLQQKLIIGERLGLVPEDTPLTPLQQDLAKLQKSLRLKPSAADIELILDLRKPNDLQRSYLLRQLRLLGCHWGEGGNEARGKGTFKESWRIQWKPEFEIKLIEAGRWGNTIKAAANGATIARANDQSLEELAALAQDALFADLDTAVDVLMQTLQAEAARAADVLHLMAALPNLAHLLRYGDVRKTSLDTVQTVVAGMITRVCIGLPNSCVSLNEEAAEHLHQLIQGVQTAVALLDNIEFTESWHHTLISMLDREDIHALLTGRCCQLLLNAGAIDDTEAARQFGLALSVANDPGQAAAWADGFLRGSGQLLIYDQSLWEILDQWISQLPSEAFINMLPVLRRTFSSFDMPERRQIGERVKHQKASLPGTLPQSDFDHQRARQVLPTVSRLLGLEVDHGSG
ncbi:MAG: DUF5682 family protein [Gammaproteobacteria bacterium]|nr:DUF5682 family protein [Gammaproteobacteria bacterium]